jgi:hypothetical protein
MRSGLLRQSFIALLILALASAWQVAPSFATQPCGMDNGAALAASGSCIGHFKSAAGDCTKATICCGMISTNLAVPSVPSVTPIDWVRVAPRDDVQSLVGRRLQPDLAIRTIVGRCFPRLIEAKCEVETCQTLQALQTVKTGREFLSRRGAPLSSAR